MVSGVGFSISADMAFCPGSLLNYPAQNTTRPDGSAIDGRVTRHAGYALSVRSRKRIEQVFGWIKSTGLMRQVKLRGVRRAFRRFFIFKRGLKICVFRYLKYLYSP
jgi:hypothetical protein